MTSNLFFQTNHAFVNTISFINKLVCLCLLELGQSATLVEKAVSLPLMICVDFQLCSQILKRLKAKSARLLGLNIAQVI